MSMLPWLWLSGISVIVCLMWLFAEGLNTPAYIERPLRWLAISAIVFTFALSLHMGSA